MQNTYCLPIIKTKKDEVLLEIKKHSDAYAYFEVWLDYIDDLDAVFITELLAQWEEKLIFLFRRKNLETPRMHTDQQREILQLLHGKRALLDADITTQQDILSIVGDQQLDIPLITSYHNYETTPSDDALFGLINQMRTYSPAIYKVSTFCENKGDGLRLLKLLLELKEQGQRCIMLGMGENGTITRIYGTLWGNEMIFAPLTKEEASAPGQLTKDELEKIFELLVKS